MDIRHFEGRKREHIQQALNTSNQAVGLSGLDRIHLVHDSLPDLDFDEVTLSAECLGSLGRPLPTPFYVAGMTAGHPDAPELNRRLARACHERGWAMGVGSQRRELEAGGCDGDLDNWKRIREETPGLVLVANLGISQLIGASVEKIRAVVQALGAQALAVHLNPLQEALQPEGTPHFKGAFAALKSLCETLEVPVVLKETGCGMSRAMLERLKGVRLAALDVSGLGGTHWGRIEGARAGAESLQARAAQTFANWGETTVDSVLAAHEVLPALEIWASGGVRSGLDAAKLIALGATRVGYAKPALEAALEGEEALRRWMELQEFELKVALFCTGTASPSNLREKSRASFAGQRV